MLNCGERVGKSCHEEEEDDDECSRCQETEPNQSNEPAELLDIAKVDQDDAQPDSKSHPAHFRPESTRYDHTIVSEIDNIDDQDVQNCGYTLPHSTNVVAVTKPGEQHAKIVD